MRSVDRRVTIGALSVEVETRWRGWIETEVELGHPGVAAVAELRYPLMRKHVAVGAAVGGVTGRTPLDARRRMLEDERAAFVCVTLHALLLLEPTEKDARLRRVGVVAGRAIERPLMQAVALVKRELRKDISVTIRTDGGGSPR